MKFGLFYEHQLPRPPDQEQWDPDAEHKMMKNALDQIELADQLGFDYVFEVEHHFLEEYSHSSAPEVFLAAASQRTKNIRLGHGIVLMPPRYNHPARVAERIATLDLVSDGRVEFGTGESSSEMEMGGFGVAPRGQEADVGRGHARVREDDDQTPYQGVEGAYFGMPSRNVVPKPLQKPHPPLWVASSRRETTMVAARLGMGSLGFSFETPDEAQGARGRVLPARARGVLPDRRGDQPGAGRGLRPLLLRQDEEAIDKGQEGAQFFAYSLAYYYNPFTGGAHKPGRKNIYDDFYSAPPDGALGAVRRRLPRLRRLRRRRLRRGAEGRDDAGALAGRPARRLHRLAGVRQGHAAQVRGRAPGPDDLRRPVRRPQARGRDGLDLPDRHEGDPGVQGAARGAPEVARAAAGGRGVPDQLDDLGTAGYHQEKNMLHMMIAEHEAESCPASHMSVREAYLPYMARLDETAKPLGATIVGAWANMPAHVLYFVVEAPNAHVVTQLAMDLHLMDWNTVNVHPVVDTQEATRKAGERKI